MAQNRKTRRVAASKARKRKSNGVADPPMRLHGAQLRKIQHSNRELLNLKAQHSDMCREAQNLGREIEQRQAVHRQLARHMLEALGIEIEPGFDYNIDPENGAIVKRRPQMGIALPMKDGKSDEADADAEADVAPPASKTKPRKKAAAKGNEPN